MSNRIKILISIDWFLPGTKSGGPVRSYVNLIAHLKGDFDFFIVTRNTDYGSAKPYKGITANIWVQLNAHTKVFYLSEENINKVYLSQLYKTINFDVAYINGIYSYKFSILPVLILKKHSKPIIVSARGMLNPQAFSVKKRKKKLYLKWAKIFSIYRSVIFHATNKEEAQYITKEIGRNAIISIAPNLPRKREQLFLETAKHQPVKFVNLARIAKEKGTLTMLEALSHVNEPMHLDIFGPIYDSNYWEKCQSIITTLPKHIVVIYKGVLESEAVPQTLKDYDFFVMLSEGENFGHAILEALSVGLPVIISNKTPWKNLKTKKIGWDLDTNDKKSIYQTYQNAILMQNDIYRIWSKNAYNFADKFINDKDLIEQNKALFLNAIKQ